MKRCKIAPTVCLCSDGPCCKDCKFRDCTVRCLNTPDRCGCMEEGPPPRSRVRGKGGGRYLDWDEIARLRGLDLTIAQIAEQLGCSVQAVNNALKKMGVSERGQS